MIIDSNFCDIIDTLKECQGKIVLTGIGKSAIIGMKISATLNSTGSKSIFLHLGDALHGDMGVIGNRRCSYLYFKKWRVRRNYFII